MRGDGNPSASRGLSFSMVDTTLPVGEGIDPASNDGAADSW
jgi:hypothetical protein